MVLTFLHAGLQILAEAGGSHIRIIAKIESQAGVYNFDSILAETDGEFWKDHFPFRVFTSTTHTQGSIHFVLVNAHGAVLCSGPAFNPGAAAKASGLWHIEHVPRPNVCTLKSSIVLQASWLRGVTWRWRSPLRRWRWPRR